MSEYSYEVLNLNNETDIIEYEKGLYNAFITKSPDGWISNYYLKVGNDRLRHPVLDFKDQAITVIRKNDKIIAASAQNINHQKYLELEKKGFSILEKDRGSRIADGLNSFVTDGEIPSDQFIDIYGSYTEFMLEDLKSRGITILYGTIYRKLKALFSMMGFETIEKLDVNGKKMYLQRLVLSDYKGG